MSSSDNQQVRVLAQEKGAHSALFRSQIPWHFINDSQSAQRALNENYFLHMHNKLILMAEGGTSWQAVGRPQCGQHKLLSFAGIIAVATVAVVAKWVFFPVCLCGEYHLWPDSAIPWIQGCPLWDLDHPWSILRMSNMHFPTATATAWGR